MYSNKNAVIGLDYTVMIAKVGSASRCTKCKCDKYM